MRRAVAPLICLAALALALGACGGGSATSTQASIANGGWIARADAICTATERRIDPIDAEIEALRSRHTNPLTLLDWIHLLRRYESAAKTEPSTLARLRIPPGERPGFQAFLTELRVAVQRGHEGIEALERGSFGEMSRLSRRNHEAGIEAGKIAGRLGLKACAA
jgi:hypothetical protein